MQVVRAGVLASKEGSRLILEHRIEAAEQRQRAEAAEADLAKVRDEMTDLREEKGEDYTRGYRDGRMSVDVDARCKEEARAAWMGCLRFCYPHSKTDPSHPMARGFGRYWADRQGEGFDPQAEARRVLEGNDKKEGGDDE